MAIALVCWRSMLRASWRQAVVVTLLGGVLGAVALAALAGARLTAGAYGRYLKAINASDVQVNVPGVLPGLPIMEPCQAIVVAARRRLPRHVRIPPLTLIAALLALVVAGNPRRASRPAGRGRPPPHSRRVAYRFCRSGRGGARFASHAFFPMTPHLLQPIRPGGRTAGAPRRALQDVEKVVTANG